MLAPDSVCIKTPQRGSEHPDGVCLPQCSEARGEGVHAYPMCSLKKSLVPLLLTEVLSAVRPSMRDEETCGQS